MKLRVYLTLAATGLMTCALLTERADAGPHPVLARFEKDDKKKPPARGKAKGKKDAAAGPGAISSKRIALTPAGMKWGMSLNAIARIYDKEFDAEFVPLYKKVQPGPRMQALDAELAEKKAMIRRNKVEFGKLPTGLDQGPLKIEYSYGNGESLTRTSLRSGTQRYFFFFNDKLWKVYDEHPLRTGGPYGETYAEAVKVLTKKFGVAPKVVGQDFEKGQNFEESHWHDGGTLIRAVNREPVLALVYVDRSVHGNLASLRKNKPQDPHSLDRDVAAVTKKPEPEQGPGKPEADKGKEPKKNEKSRSE
jgi:hypothetical protein